MNKRVVIVSPVVCAPAYSGNSARIAQFIKALESMSVEVHFILAPIKEISDRRQGDAMKSLFGERYHCMNQGNQLRGTILNRGWKYLKRKGLRRYAIFQDFMLPWQLYNSDELNEFKALIEDIKPDFIIGEYVLTAPLIRSLNNTIPTAVETHDCFTDRNKKIRKTNGGGLWWTLTASQERKLLSAFRSVIAIQETEKVFFERLLKGREVSICKVDVLDVPREICDLNNKAPVIGFVGSDNAHNREGLEIFIHKQWPRIKNNIPSAQLLVAGDVKFDSTESGILALGRVERLFDDFYNKCALIINPCVTGSGLKIKTVEAMSYGMPVVATQEGVSGIESSVGQGVYCEELNEKSFSDTCISLLTDEKLRISQGNLSRIYIEKAYQESLNTIQTLIQ